MKLYYSPFACSMAAHLTCREAGLDVTLVRVELATKRVEGEADLFTHNPMGQVPTLVTDDGHTVIENAAVLTYLADRVPEKQLAPPREAFERYALTRWLGFVGAELHKKGLAPIFAPDSPEVVKAHARASLARPVATVAAHLEGRETLLGGPFTVADAYLFWALTLLPRAGVPLDAQPTLRGYYQRHLTRPAVRETLAFERAQHERAFAA